MIRLWPYLFLIVALVSSVAATPYREIKRGNQAADSGDAAAAHYHYLKALEQGGDTNLVEYNVGNLLYNVQDYEKAQYAYMASLDTMQDKQAQSEALYNLANSYFQSQQYEPAIKAYIESLKRNPDDMQAKQNLEMALRMMQQQQQQQNQQCDNKEDQQDQEQQQQQDQQQNQEQQEQDQQKQDEQQQQQQQDDQQQQEEQQQQQQAQPQEMTKEEAEQLLNALMQDEQDALQKVKQAKVQGRKKRERDW